MIQLFCLRYNLIFYHDRFLSHARSHALGSSIFQLALQYSGAMSLLSDQQLASASQAGAYPWLSLVDDGIQGFCYKYWRVVSVAPSCRERVE